MAPARRPLRRLVSRRGGGPAATVDNGARAGMVGGAAPAIGGVNPAGEAVGPARVEGVVVFLTSSCLACREVWGVLRDEPGLTAGLPAVTVVTPDPTLEDRRAVAALGAGVEVVMSTRAWADFAASGSPWVAVVRGGTVVAEGPAAGWADVAALAAGR